MADARYAMTKDGWYSDAENYWKGIPATTDGMLGGFSHISTVDIEGSSKFLRKTLLEHTGNSRAHRALDCGAGIGRVSKNLLLRHVDTVDLVELNQDFLDEAKRSYLGEDVQKVEKYICSGLQNFKPEPKRYDVIWCQWVLGHLTDDHFVDFFKRCKDGLSDKGFFGVKENITKKGLELDEDDSSVTRSSKLLRRLFDRAGLTILKEEIQTDFPIGLYTVKMFALK
ncbi:N-terminal Xaa-Pro-Lys N-methyltransferase 1-like [Glandiceps talaboti]